MCGFDFLWANNANTPIHDDQQTCHMFGHIWVIHTSRPRVDLAYEHPITACGWFPLADSKNLDRGNFLLAVPNNPDVLTPQAAFQQMKRNHSETPTVGCLKPQDPNNPKCCDAVCFKLRLSQGKKCSDSTLLDETVLNDPRHRSERRRPS